MKRSLEPYSHKMQKRPVKQPLQAVNKTGIKQGISKPLKASPCYPQISSRKQA